MLCLAVLCSVIESGCAHPKRHSGISALIDPPCLIGPILLQDCDMSQAEPKCKVVKVRYKQGCERLVVDK